MFLGLKIPKQIRETSTERSARSHYHSRVALCRGLPARPQATLNEKIPAWSAFELATRRKHRNRGKGMASADTDGSSINTAGPDNEREALLQTDQGTTTATSSARAGNLDVESGLQAPFQSPDEKTGSRPVRVDLLATLSLLAVAVIWGTYSPVLRYLYQLDGPPTPAVLTAVRGTFQALILLLPGFFIGNCPTNLVLTRAVHGYTCYLHVRAPLTSYCLRDIENDACARNTHFADWWLLRPHSTGFAQV